MEVFDAVRTLLAVRSYQERPVPEPVIRRVLEAGRLSASAANKQPWRFVVVQDRDALRQIGPLVSSGLYVAQAPLAIVVAVNRTPYAVSDASRAIQSMLLMAWSEGVGGNWTGFGGLEGVGTLLGIPAELDVLAVLPLGYPADAVGRGKKRRKPLDQIAHRERWGNPFVWHRRISMARRAEEHPAVLDELTTTQMAELQRQFDEGDRVSFDVHVDSYGLDRDVGNAVWDWFAGGDTERLAVPVGADDHVRGPADAPATVVVYGDYECPHTRRAHLSVKALERRIGDRFRLVFRHFPLREIHPGAEASAELAEAAADRGKFWEMHDHLFAHQKTLDPAHLRVYAAEFGIPSEGSDQGHFEAGHRYADRIEDDLQGGIRSGVGGTPAVDVDGRRHRGGYDEATLERAISLAR